MAKFTFLCVCGCEFETNVIPAECPKCGTAFDEEDIEEFFRQEIRKAIERLKEDGLIVVEEDTITLTEKGKKFAQALEVIYEIEYPDVLKKIYETIEEIGRDEG